MQQDDERVTKDDVNQFSFFCARTSFNHSLTLENLVFLTERQYVQLMHKCQLLSCGFFSVGDLLLFSTLTFLSNHES